MSQGCPRWRGDLGAYVIDTLDKEERAAMKRHLEACPPCRADYKHLLPVRDLLARTKHHLVTCRACRVEYEGLLR